MRTLTLAGLLLFGALLVLGAAVCGGDGDGDGEEDGAEQADLQEFNVQAELAIELLEDFVSAAPSLQGTQGFSGTGTGTADLGFGESGTIQFGDLTIDFSVSGGDGQSLAIQAMGRPDESSGTVEDSDDSVQGWTMDVALDFDVNSGRPTLTTEEPLPLEGSASLTSDGEVEGASLGTSSDFSADLVDEDGNTQGVVSAVVLSFANPAVLSQDGDETGGEPGAVVPPPVSVPNGFEYMLLFGASSNSFTVTTHDDGPGGHLYGDPSFTAGFAQDENDIIDVDIARLNITPESGDILNSLLPCGTTVVDIYTACSDPSASFPSGEVYMIAARLGGGPPLPGDPVLNDHQCTYANAFNFQGGANFSPGGPFTEDFYGGTFYWGETVGGLGSDYQESLSTAPARTPVADANARQLLIPGANRVVGFTPVDAVPDASGVRVTADCHLADFNPSGSGGDILGGLPSTSPLTQLPGSDKLMDIDVAALLQEHSAAAGDVPESDALLGDVNCDGEVNSSDALMILSHDAGLPIPEDACLEVGDVNDDGVVNSTDALIVLSFDADIPVPFPVGEPVG